jgi:hypothetical protein
MLVTTSDDIVVVVVDSKGLIVESFTDDVKYLSRDISYLRI